MKKITASIDINASKESIWTIVTDIENTVNNVSAIKKVEILEPGTPFLGLKWRETREMFGKESTEVMWIDDCKEFEFYKVRAASHGSKYYTDLYIKEIENGCSVTIEFSAQVESVSAKIVNFLIGWLFTGATKKAFLQDLEDIKGCIEHKS